MKAGHLRAFARLERSIMHWRCPSCLEDARPQVRPDGLRCPLCAGVDTRSRVIVEQRPTRSGFRWVARLEEPVKES